MQLIAYGLLALALLGAIGTGVYKVKEWGADEVRQEWAQANEKARAEEAERSAKAAADLEAERKKRKVVVKTITKEVDREVEKLVYRSVCLPDRGLCLANAAILGTVAPSCLSDGAVPPAKPPG